MLTKLKSSIIAGSNPPSVARPALHYDHISAVTSYATFNGFHDDGVSAVYGLQVLCSENWLQWVPQHAAFQQL